MRSHAFVAHVRVEERFWKQVAGEVRYIRQPIGRKSLIAAYAAGNNQYQFVAGTRGSQPTLVRSRLGKHKTGHQHSRCAQKHPLGAVYDASRIDNEFGADFSAWAKSVLHLQTS